MVRPFIFPALTIWGTRGTLALRPFRAAAFFRCTDPAGCTNRVSVFASNGRGLFAEIQRGELRSAERGDSRRPPRGKKGRTTCGFPSSLNSCLSLAS